MLEKKHIKHAAQIISTHSSTIAKSISNQHKYPQIYIFIENLMYLLSKSLENITNKKALTEFKNTGFKNGNMTLDQEIFIRTVDLFPLVSQSITSILKEKMDHHIISHDEYYILLKKIDEMILHFNSGYICGYLHFHQTKVDTHLSEELMELSVPIIKIDHHIGVCPLIGEIDAEKATILMNKTVHNVVDKKIEYLILDLTGIGSVEDSGLQQLFKAVSTMELVGTTIIFTGIRSQIAMSSALLNMDLSKKHVYHTVRDAVISLSKSSENIL
ncbi:STAS domain-containing protein [Gracilibacillus massiliensis]|uniref:STAS domain-containing protein n=1 Tax=Gracilibacillus massiliensis TaxID=1564956 RepID=UPI00071C647A|nr:STAS domain-containing protein [Gracilibacillus massiliensis]